MFRIKSFLSTASNEKSKRGSTSSVDTNGRLTDPSVEIDDPLLLRLNHQRELQREKIKQRASCDSEVFIGWEQKKDPFDLDTTSSENEDEDMCGDKRDFNVLTKTQEEDDEKANFSSSDMDLFVKEMSVRSGLSDSSDTLLDCQQQPKDTVEVKTSKIDHSSSTGSGRRSHQMSHESIDKDASSVLDESSRTDKVSLALTDIDDSEISATEPPQNFRCSTKQGDEVKSPIPRRDNMFRRSTTSGSNQSHQYRKRLSISTTASNQTPPYDRLSGDSSCDNRSTHGIRRRQSFSDFLSASLRNIGADNLAASIRSMVSDIDLQSQPSTQQFLKIESEEDGVCPRLQQLKEHSADELHNELIRIQVRCKSNLESSWAEAERIRQSNDELDEEIASMKARLEKAKAAAEASKNNRGPSPSQESCVMSTVSEAALPMKKVLSRNFIFGGNVNDNDSCNDVTRKNRSDSRLETKKPKGRRKTFMGDFSSYKNKSGSETGDDASCISSQSHLGMTIDDMSVHDAMSGFYKQYIGESRNESVDLIRRTFSRETGSYATTDDNVSEIRSTIDSLQSSVSDPLTHEPTIFEVEAVKLQLQDLQEQLSARTDSIERMEASLVKQSGDLKVNCDAIRELVEQAKKLQEIETSTMHDLADFNHCFRAIDGKLQIIESIAYETKRILEDSNLLNLFENVQLDSIQLKQAHESVDFDPDKVCALDILNDRSAFHQYQDCKNKIMGNIYRMDFLEADLRSHLVKIRLLMEQVGDDEGTVTTESSMASERRALERVFVETIIPHIQFAYRTKKNMYVAFEEEVKLLRFWNHVIHSMECFRAPDKVTQSVDFISKETSLSLKKDLHLLKRIHEVTAEYLKNIEADIKRECVSFRSKVERAGLVSLNINSSNEMSLDNTKQGEKHRSLVQSNNLESNNLFKSKLLEKGRVIAQKDNLLKRHAAQLKSLHSRSKKELSAQLDLLNKLQNQVQTYSNKMIEQDSLLTSLSNTHEKKVARVLRFQKIAGEQCTL